MKTDDQERVAEVVDALELLAGRLSPEVLSRPSDRPIEAEN
jgi:hypothetical protein